MYGDQKARIEQIIQDGYDFKFGDYIGRGFDIAKKNWGGFIGYTILFILLSMVISFIPFIGTIANTFFISPALTVGFYLVANKLWKGENTEFGDFFKGFDDIGQLALTAFVQIMIILISAIPFYFVIKDSGLIEWYIQLMGDPVGMQGTVPPTPATWSYLLLLPAMYLGIAYSWSYMFVVFFKMQFWDALESSRRLITKKWFVFFGFYIVLGLIAAAGVIALCVGLLFAIPAVYCMMYAAFEDVTQLNSGTDEPDDIAQHLIAD